MPSTTHRSDDSVLAALTLVCGLVCQKKLSDEELAYVHSRLEGIRKDILLESIEYVGDTEARVVNPIAAIRERAGILIREDREARQARRIEAEDYEAVPTEAARDSYRSILKRLAAAKMVPLA